MNADQFPPYAKPTGRVLHESERHPPCSEAAPGCPSQGHRELHPGQRADAGGG